MDIIAKSSYRDKVCTSVNDAYLHSDYWESKWGFIIEMGKRLGTNFGFMFDWTTGETYPDDDPRRRQISSNSKEKSLKRFQPNQTEASKEDWF